MKKFFLPVFLLFAAAPLFAATAASGWLITGAYPGPAAEGLSAGYSSFGVRYASINPAAMAGVENFSFEAMHALFPADISLDRITAGKSLDFGIIGIDIGYYNFGQVFDLGVDSSLSPVVTGATTSPYAFLASAIYAKKLDYFSVGFSLKAACQNFGSGMDAIALADAGMIADDIFTKGLSFGAGITDISGDQGGFSTPLDAGAGFSYCITGKTGGEMLKLSISGDYLPALDELKGSAGFDFPVTQELVIRAGVGAPWNGPVKFYGGLSVKAMGLSFNYAYLPDTSIGDVNKVSIGADFGRPAEKEEAKPAEKAADIFGGYMSSGDFYYDSGDFRKAVKYYEYVNLLYWKELESLTDVQKSNFYQKLGICYYNMRDNGRALQYFDRAFYYDKENEILKHWIRLLKK